MTHKHLLFHSAAKAKILRGTTALADAVRVTLGPRSKCVLIAKEWGTPRVCDDGVSIAKEMSLPDPEEDLGARMIREAAVRTGDAVGDGTTTSTLLAHSIYADGLRNVTAGASAVGIRQGLERGARIAVEELRKLSRPVEGAAEREHVARISAHGDETVGRLVAEATEKVGPEGVITVEEAKGTETELEVVEGMQFDRGYLSPYFVTSPERMECVLEQPFILLHEKRISSMQALLPVLERVVQGGRSLLVVAEDIDAESLATLVVNRMRGSLPCAAVKAPGFGDRRRAMLEDLAILTGGQVVSEDLGLKLENVTEAHLGTAARVVVTASDTTVVGGKGRKERIEGRIEQLRKQIAESTSDYDREKLEERLAKLVGGVAVLRVGAPSEAEMRNRKDAFDDAIASTRAAVEEGIVPGGGVALIRAIPAVQAAAETAQGDERTGLRILATALETPARQIAANSDKDGGVVVEHIREHEGAYGFDARVGEYGDLVQKGIIDPTKVVRIALENAVSVASTLLLTEATMTDIPEKKSDGARVPEALEL